MNKKKLKKKLLNLWKDIKKTCKKVYKDFWDHKKHPKKIDRWFSRANSVLVVLISGMIIFGLFWQLGGIVKDSIEDFIEERFISKLIDTQQLVFQNSSGAGYSINPDSAVDTNGKLVSSSFTDLFSGVGWINKEKTTLYHDQTTTALSFPPNFDWNRVEESEVDLDRFVEKREDGSDRRCLGSECLMQKDLNLYFGGQSVDNLESSNYEIDLPREVNLDNLVNISIGTLGNRWAVGFVEEVEDSYEGRAYYFNGASFQPIGEGDIFESDYEGRIGFGGNEDNFLIIYGGYNGKGYHVVSGEELKDISDFLGIRLMGEGFHPEIIKGQNGSWYVYSLTPGNSKFIKLFQNETESIQGAVDLTELLSIFRVESSSFYLSDDYTLYSKVDSSGESPGYWRFVDNGFDKTNSQVVFSSNINNNPSEVREASIADVNMSDLGGDVNFYLSNNNRDWFEVDIGETVQFPNEEGRQLIWKAEVSPDDNPRTTPFLDLIRLNYKIHFL